MTYRPSLKMINKGILHTEEEEIQFKTQEHRKE
jgi:hypothetical protein